MTPGKVEQIERAAQERLTREPRTRAAALARLIADGIYTSDGKLAPQFSTDPQPIAEFLAQP